MTNGFAILPAYFDSESFNEFLQVINFANLFTITVAHHNSCCDI